MGLAPAGVPAATEDSHATRVLHDPGSMSETAHELQTELDSLRKGKVEMSRELKGMGSLVKILTKKIAIYEQRLLDQAQSCAHELNSLMTQLETVSAQGDDIDDGMDDPEHWPQLSGLHLSGLQSMIQNKLSEGGLPSMIQKRLSGNQTGVAEGYMAFNDHSSSAGIAPSPGGVFTDTRSAALQKQVNTDEKENAGTYRPPKLPAGI